MEQFPWGEESTRDEDDVLATNPGFRSRLPRCFSKLMFHSTFYSFLLVSSFKFRSASDRGLVSIIMLGLLCVQACIGPLVRRDRNYHFNLVEAVVQEAILRTDTTVSSLLLQADNEVQQFQFPSFLSVRYIPDRSKTLSVSASHPVCTHDLDS